jgi:hypothetical protein
MPPIALELPDLFVFPCQRDKTPARGLPGGFYSAVQGRDKIADLFRRYPGELVGVPCGPANWFDVLDVDKGGEDFLALYESTYGPLPPTRVHASPRGGQHYFWRHQIGLRCSRSLLAPKIDVRAEGGYVIFAGPGYRVLSSAPIAPWPPRLLELINEAEVARTAPRVAARAGHPVNGLNGALVATGGAYKELPRALYFRMCKLMPDSSGRDRRRVRELLSIVVETREGRNDTINRIAFLFRTLIAEGVIEPAAAEELLFASAVACGYVAKDGAPAARATIASGLGLQAQELHSIKQEELE